MSRFTFICRINQIKLKFVVESLKRTRSEVKQQSSPQPARVSLLKAGSLQEPSSGYASCGGRTFAFPRDSAAQALQEDVGGFLVQARHRSHRRRDEFTDAVQENILTTTHHNEDRHLATTSQDSEGDGTWSGEFPAFLQNKSPEWAWNSPRQTEKHLSSYN